MAVNIRQCSERLTEETYGNAVLQKDAEYTMDGAWKQWVSFKENVNKKVT